MGDAPRPISVETLLAERTWVEALARSLVADRATADDLVQETWLAAIENPPRSSPRGWLSRVVRNAALETRRRSARRERRESLASARSASPSAADVVAKAEAHRRVVEAVMSLDEPYRAAVLLRFFEGLAADEVARRTGVPVETARTRIKRALAILRGRLDRDHGDVRAWALALLPSLGAKKSAAAAATGGAVMAGSMKFVAVAAVGGIALGAVATGVALSRRDAPPPEPATAELPVAPRPAPRDRRGQAPPPAVSSSDRGSTLARAIDEIPVDLPRPVAEVLSGHVTTDAGDPLAGVVVRAFARREVGVARTTAPTPSVEESVRAAAIDAKWRAATLRESTTDAAGSYSLSGLIDATYSIEAIAPGCTFQPKPTPLAPPAPGSFSTRSVRTDASAVRPGTIVDFVAGPVGVPIVVLMPDATPVRERALVRFAPPEGYRGLRPANFTWTPDAPIAPVIAGTWGATAEIGRGLRSPPVSFTATPGIAPSAVTLHLAAVDPSAAATLDWSGLSALGWLRRRQSADGGWGDPAATGAALLCFLGAGETHQQGSSRTEVANAGKYLRDRQDEAGAFVDPNGPHALRDDAVAALAIVESYAMTGSRVFKEPAQRAAAFAMKSRTPSMGWGLTPGGGLDVETTAWMALLAKSAQGADLDVDKSALEDVVAAIDRVTDRATGRVSASAAGGNASDVAATGVGILARLLAGRSATSDEEIVNGAAFLESNAPSSDAGRPADYVGWYFGTLALSRVGGEPWTKWSAALKTAVVDRQRADDAGDDRGSWDTGTDAPAGERVWATALNALCMEVFLRYDRVAGAK